MVEPRHRYPPRSAKGLHQGDLLSAVVFFPRRSIHRSLVRVRMYFSQPFQIEIWIWAACIFLLTTPFTFTLMGEDPTARVVRDTVTMRRAENSQILVYGLRFGLFMLAAAFSLQRWRLSLRALPRLWPMCGFLGWLVLTILWSDSPDSTIHATVALVPLILTGFMIGVRLPPHLGARAVVHSGLLMAICSLIECLLSPGYGLHQFTDASQSVHAGAWRGIYLHKNHLGQLAAMYLATIVLAGPSVVQSRFYKWSLAALMLFLIIQSTSASAIAIVPIALFMIWYIVILNPVKKIFASIVALAGGIAALLSLNILLEALGRDATLSGRTKVWETAMGFFLQRPLQGFGYQSSTYGGFVAELRSLMGLGDPHNGYLDMLLGVGAIGLFLFIFAVASSWVVARGIYRIGGAYRQGILVLTAPGIAYMITSITEANFRPFVAAAGLGFCSIAMVLAAPRLRKLRNNRPINPFLKEQAQGINDSRGGNSPPVMPNRGRAAVGKF